MLTQIAPTCTPSPAFLHPDHSSLRYHRFQQKPKGPLNLAEESLRARETMSPPGRTRRSQAPVAAA